MYDNFCTDFLLYDVIDFVRMKKSIVESCVDKTCLDRLSCFGRCWSFLLSLLIALRRNLLRIDKASLLETFGSLRTFGISATHQVVYNCSESQCQWITTELPFLLLITSGIVSTKTINTLRFILTFLWTCWMSGGYSKKSLGPTFSICLIKYRLYAA